MDPHTANPLLARAADRLLRGHHPDDAQPSRCAHPRCHQPFPCSTVRVAAQAAAQADDAAVRTARELAGVGGAAWR
ncbi:hypothetical protein [Actinocatenispora rupis]|uniref:Uncharacterized protein n=1 Tax=Actinocatenispora rupis TaxID=519421 RepID=A0A8J3JDG6_9ACTN|nr:hypothetical protein [Actinocatenispora rupis]GID12783.1 hypothetical protein Aru02nite_36720 [Actinocatenispora rupis]